LLLLLALGAVCAPLATAVPSGERVSRIGFLAFGAPPPDPVPPALSLTAFDKGYMNSAISTATPLFWKSAGQRASLPASLLGRRN
jgi:hypothetical protein